MINTPRVLEGNKPTNGIARGSAPVHELDHQSQGHLQRIRTIVMVSHGEVSHLLDQERRSGRATLKAKLPMSQVGTQAPDSHLFVGRVVDGVDRHVNLLLLTSS